jgi:bacillithiol system protein YtxJ
MKPLTESDAVDAIMGEPLAVVVKHSPSCAISHWAMLELQRFQQENPGCPVHVIDVLRSRPVSRYVADRTRIRHESPQVLVLRDGNVVWSGSHESITARAVARSVALASEPG